MPASALPPLPRNRDIYSAAISGRCTVPSRKATAQPERGTLGRPAFPKMFIYTNGPLPDEGEGGHNVLFPWLTRALEAVVVRIRVSMHGVVCLVLSSPQSLAPFQRRGLERAFCRRGAHPTVVCLGEGGMPMAEGRVSSSVQRLAMARGWGVGFAWACEMYTASTLRLGSRLLTPRQSAIWLVTHHPSPITRHPSPSTPVFPHIDISCACGQGAGTRCLPPTCRHCAAACPGREVPSGCTLSGGQDMERPVIAPHPIPHRPSWSLCPCLPEPPMYLSPAVLCTPPWKLWDPPAGRPGSIPRRPKPANSHLECRRRQALGRLLSSCSTRPVAVAVDCAAPCLPSVYQPAPARY